MLKRLALIALAIGLSSGIALSQINDNGGGLLPNAVNVTLPTARDNINAGLIARSVYDFGAKCDVLYPTSYTITAGTNVLTANATTFTTKDIGKKVLLPGQTATGGVLHTSITGVSGGNALLADNAAAVAGTIKQITLGATFIVRGAGYAPTNTITIAGGTGTVSTVLTVMTTATSGTPTINAAGSGGTNGSGQLAYGTTGNGNRVVLSVTVTGGALASIDSVVDAGHYTTNPTTIGQEPILISGNALAGAKINMTMGVDLVKPTTPGIYTNGLYPTNPASQASSSGAGTGATFTLIPFYNSAGLVYGTDDSAAFTNAATPTSWTPTPQNGATIALPDASCGLASTVTIAGSSTQLSAPDNGATFTAQGALALARPTIQWLGVDGGTVFTFAPPGVNQGNGNGISGVTIECGVPNTLNQTYSIPVAGIGLNLLSQTRGFFHDLSFDVCSSYDIYTSVTGSSVDFKDNDLYNIGMYHPLPYDGIGLYMTGIVFDSDLNRINNVYGSYVNRPLIQLVTLDNNTINHMQLFQRPGFIPGVYGLDLTGKIYGSTEADQANSLTITQLSGSSIARGLESAASPPTNILVFAFDKSNLVVPTVTRPGGGKLSYIDYDGTTVLAGPVTIAGTTTTNGALIAGGGATVNVTSPIATALTLNSNTNGVTTINLTGTANEQVLIGPTGQWRWINHAQNVSNFTFTDSGTLTTAGALNAGTFASVVGTTLPTQAAGTLGIGGIASAPTLAANGEGDFYLSTTNGLIHQGQGSTNDQTFLAANGTVAGQVLHNGAMSLPSPAFTGTVTGAGTIPNGVLKTYAHTASSVAAPTGTASLTGVMMGLAGTITPVNSGTVAFTVCGDVAQNTASDGANIQLRTGTGAAPINGAALTGTTRGSLIKQNNVSAVVEKVPFCLHWTVTGLALSTAVWIDVGLAAVTGGTASIADVDIVADEIP